MGQNMFPYLMIGGRLHGDEILMETDNNGKPPATFVDILSGFTYYPRIVGYAIHDQTTNQVVEAYEHEFYILENLPPEQAVAAVNDVLLRHYMVSHGTKQKAAPGPVQSSPNGAGGLIIPGSTG